MLIDQNVKLVKGICFAVQLEISSNQCITEKRELILLCGLMNISMLWIQSELTSIWVR